MNKTINKLVIAFLLVLGIILIPNYKADAAVTINSFTANGSSGSKTVSSGTQVTLAWDTTGATSCSNNFGGPTTPSGQYVYTASNGTGSPVATTYTINCVGRPETPTGLTVTPRNCSSGMMDITWNAVPGVNGYRLYDDSINGFIYNGTATELFQSGLVLGSSHIYTIGSYDSDLSSLLSSPVSGTVAGACAPTYDYYDLTPCVGNPVYPTHYQTGPFPSGTYQYNDQRMGAISPTYKYYVTGMSSTPYGTSNIQTSGTGKLGCQP